MADKEEDKTTPEADEQHNHDKPESEKTVDDNDKAPATEDAEASELSAKPEAAEHAPVANPAQRCWQWLLAHKKVTIPAAVVLVIALVATIPFTRYAVAGLFVQQSLTVKVVDADTNKPVTSATVRLSGQQATTNNKGQVIIRTKVGEAKLEISKKYYQTTSREVLVPFRQSPKLTEVKLKATGRTVPVKVLNKIGNEQAPNVTIKADGAEAKTDSEGAAIVVVPANKKTVQATLSGEGFNSATVTLQVTGDSVPANTFTLTPAGKIYFLSNASGKIDLIKSDLDGANRQTVLPGTGKEDRYNTVLLASRDWQRIALLSKRDGGEYAKLFLIEANNGDKVTVMDEGEATFNLYGWSGDRFIYTVHRQKVQAWEPKREALKSYSATAKKITTLAETTAEGPQSAFVYEDFNSVFLLDQEVVFAKTWSYGGNAYNLWQGKGASFNSVRVDGSQKKTLKVYAAGYIQARTAEFGELYIQYEEGDGYKYDEYQSGKLATTTLTTDDYNAGNYPRYAVSPSGKKTLWSDYRDGKNVFFVGNEKGEDGKGIGSSEDYTVYGWYADSYVLITRKDSELHIMPAAGLDGGVEKSLKLSDYYKPDYQNRGFGYGYGG
jgi:hypothetical protein